MKSSTVSKKKVEELSAEKDDGTGISNASKKTFADDAAEKEEDKGERLGQLIAIFFV